MKQLTRLVLLTGLLLVGCATADSGAAVETVENYLQAKIEADSDRLQTLLCSAMEADLAREARTFATVTDVEIQDMACTFDAATSTVTCDGQIVAVYGAEDTTFALGTYRVVQEDGEWRWCGESS